MVGCPSFETFCASPETAPLPTLPPGAEAMTPELLTCATQPPEGFYEDAQPCRWLLVI